MCSVPSDDPVTGARYPWLTNSTAMVNHIFDENFGPLFLKFCSCFPCQALSGTTTSRCNWTKRGVAALDNGILRCDDHEVMDAIAQEITPACALLCKWLARLPHPFTAQDRGVRYDISVLQAE